MRTSQGEGAVCPKARVSLAMAGVLSVYRRSRDADETRLR